MENTAMTTAVANAPSRQIFAPMFRARWQNMQNIFTEGTFLDLVPPAYKPYYYSFIEQWRQWSSGFVTQLHRQDFFSTGIGYTVCDIFTKECMSGGYRLYSNESETKAFMEKWGDSELNSVFNRMFFYANSVGNAILVLTPVNGNIYPSVYPVNRVVFQIGRTGAITRALILNRFVSGEDSAYYTRECRIMYKGKPFYRIEIADGTLATAPVWGGRGLSEVPECVLQQWEYCYGSIKPGIWYAMPEKMRNIGCYNVRNKSVAVALQDLPGYSDSTLHTALDILYSIDYNYTQGQVDQYIGKSRTLVPKQMSGVKLINQPGTLADGMSFRDLTNINSQPLEEVFYTQIPDNNLNGDAVKPMFIQPDLRGEAHRYIRDADLELLASKVGLSSSTLANHLAYNTSGTKTDDEVSSENSTTEKSVFNKRELANTAINAMLSDVAYFYDLPGDIDIQWGRSAANTSKENQELLADYNAGTLPLRQYLRRRWTDLSEEDIEKMALDVEAAEEKREAQRQNSMFGDMEFSNTGGLT